MKPNEMYALLAERREGTVSRRALAPVKPTSDIVSCESMFQDSRGVYVGLDLTGASALRLSWVQSKSLPSSLIAAVAVAFYCLILTPAIAQPVGDAQFGYKERSASGSNAVRLATISLTLPERMAVQLHADTSATTVNSLGTTFTHGIALETLPRNVLQPSLDKASRFVTIPKATGWVTCVTSCTLELDKGEHTFIWYAGGVESGTVIFDAGHFSARAFPIDHRAPDVQSPRLALLVGIDKYRSPKVQSLAGCKNDVADMKDLLMNRFGFAESDIKVLTDAEATYDNIFKQFQTHLIDKSTKDTIAVFYYSGHGSRAKDSSGDESDGYDETLVPHDSRTPDHWDITDDDIRGMLETLKIKTNAITFIFDSCHSGTAVKDISGLPRFTEADERDAPPISRFAKPSRGILSDEQRGYVFISGCTAQQKSYEYSDGKQMRGAMTFFLTRAIRDQYQPGLTYQEVMPIVIRNVNEVRRQQTPQLEGGNADWPVFGIRARATQPSLQLVRRSDGLYLQAGSLQRVTEGSIYEVFASDAKQMTQGTGFAKVKVTEASMLESKVELVGGALKSEEAATVVEVYHQTPTRRIPMYFDVKGALTGAAQPSTALPKLKSRLETVGILGDQFVEVAEPREAWLFVTDLGDNKVGLSDGSVTIDTLVDGTEDTVQEKLHQNLQAWGKWIELSQLRISDPAFTADVQLSTPRRPDLVVPPSPWSSQFTFVDGERFNLQIKNGSASTAYATVFLLGPRGNITALVKSEELKPGAAFEKRNLTNKFSGAGPFPTRERNLIKVLITSQTLNAEEFVQPAIRAVSSFQQRILSATTLSIDYIPSVSVPPP